MNTTNKNIFSGLIEKQNKKNRQACKQIQKRWSESSVVESLDEKVMWFSPGPGRMIFVHFLDRGDIKKNKKKITLEAWRNISKVWLSTKRAERGFHQEYNNPRRQTFNIQKNNAAAKVSITIWRIFFTDFNSSVECTFCRLPLNVQKKGKKEKSYCS